MKATQSLKSMGAVATLTAIVLGVVSSSPRLLAQDPSEMLLIQQGYQIAPVPLNLAGLDPNLVGLGSFLVNAIGDCNGCHTAGQPPNLNYAAGGNPYFGQPKKVDPTVYLSGGMDFGPVSGPVGPNGYTGPDIIARNLTPDNTGLPEGGHTLSDFMQIMTTGIDFDNLHPTCTAITPTPQPANCIPSSPGNTVNGNLLQVMPWPTFQNMSAHYLQAIYAYLTAIPCLTGSTDPTNPLYNNCTPVTTPPVTGKTVAVANPKNVSVPQAIFQLDGTASTSADGKPLVFAWSLAPTSLPAVIVNANTATPTVQFGQKGTYVFVLTVTDDTGKTATDSTTIIH
ncbi:MAG: PKD domain-containing protein [Bryobacteraceae bacterium]|jgi:hypothetical protein